MNRDDIIRMAREAGLHHYGGNVDDSLERFAKLIRNDYSTKHAQLWLKRIDEAVAAEREACAKVCEAIWNYPENGMATEEQCYGDECAAAIRARGQA